MSAGPGYLNRTFRSLRVRNFRLFIGGQILSGIGTWMQWTAAPLLVLRLTGGGVAPAFLVNSISFVPLMAALGLMRRTELTARARAPRHRGQIREGLRYVWEAPDLRLPMAVMSAVFLFTFNYMVLLPLFALRTF